MDELIFRGTVTSGIGHHSELFVPGREMLPQADMEWPSVLHPGSLNIRIADYPPQFAEKKLPTTVEALDSAQFVPAFEILRDQLGNNRLRSTSAMPRRGDAQVWRARIFTASGALVRCWALRRFGSRVGEQLEFVAGRRLRDEGLCDGQHVTVILSGGWKEV